MAFGRNTFHFTSNLSITEVRQRITNNTLVKDRLTPEKTNKAFIGSVDAAGFNIISSSAVGIACTLRGELSRGTGKNNTHIDIETRTQRVFIWLILIWVLVVTAAAIVPGLLKSTYVFSPLPFLLLVFGAVAFRLFIHGLYIIVRNKAIERFRQALTA
ncbi:hypothetical protein LJ707_07255 [Mucilaginibacter sp. UR6-1]|uniref:hypothetical protein n=1 Tax=Mucilaginibacter sp. UR6-1 TaxID=1435643 RepID=UPI001E5F0341|nr:hypothetical protein [Mucilaginibacter sp. UR6-1]MCC8408720.1 hypothetical protein [Mucilaginibacter sp. UR6-1]